MKYLRMTVTCTCKMSHPLPMHAFLDSLPFRIWIASVAGAS